MKKSRLSSALFAGMMAAAVAAMAGTPAVVGDWEGALETGHGSLKVVIHLAQSEEQNLKGTLDSPDQGVTGIVVSAAKYRESGLHLEIERIGASFDGRMNKANSEMTGEWRQGSASLPLTLKRVTK